MDASSVGAGVVEDERNANGSRKGCQEVECDEKRVAVCVPHESDGYGPQLYVEGCLIHKLIK